jgi:hypothetical protein
LRDNLFTGLGIPKPFLSFQDAAGGGKNMAQYDIRFAKKVNRIQQALIQELNKMAMIHLYLMGYSKEDISDFTLTLNNPSTQQELLKAELLREKAQVYTDLTRSDNGVAAMSHTRAKRMVFNMSDNDIVEDLKQQKMEKIVQQELADAPVAIKHSGLFKDLDKKYEDEEAAAEAEAGGGADAGMETDGMDGDIPPPIDGMPNQSPSDLPPIEAEGKKQVKPILFERGMSEEDYNKHVEKMVYGNNKVFKETEKRKEVLVENDLANTTLNIKAGNMISEIDEFLEKAESLNSGTESDTGDIDYKELENIDLDKIEDVK